MSERYRLICGDNNEKLSDMEENSADSCVMDGPYGIRFMGKAWDSFDIAEKNGIRRGQESHAPGAGPNGAHKSIAAEAGKYDRNANANREFQEWTRNLSEAIYRVLKPGAYYLSFSSPRTFHRLASGIEDAGFEIRDTLMWIFASGFPKSHNLTGDRQGWGSALKPAYEPICMARKPLEKGLTIAQNVEKWGTGAIWIDGCRIDGEPWHFGSQTNIKGGNYGHRNTDIFTRGEAYAKNVAGGEEGRWPANLLLSYPEDEYILRRDITIDQKSELFKWLNENT